MSAIAFNGQIRRQGEKPSLCDGTVGGERGDKTLAGFVASVGETRYLRGKLTRRTVGDSRMTGDEKTPKGLNDESNTRDL